MTEICMRGGKRMMEGGWRGKLAVCKQWWGERGWGGGHLVGTWGGRGGEEAQARGGVGEMSLVLGWKGRVVLS